LFASQEGRYLWHVNQAPAAAVPGAGEIPGKCEQWRRGDRFERLDALPHARLCIKCRAKEEDESAANRRLFLDDRRGGRAADLVTKSWRFLLARPSPVQVIGEYASCASCTTMRGVRAVSRRLLALISSARESSRPVRAALQW